MDAGDAEAVVEAIDRCLDRHIVHSHVNKALRHVTSLHRGLDGELRLRRQDVQALAPAVARVLELPEWLFEGLGDLFDSFDFDGDGTLDEVETKRMFKKLLQHRRRELGGKRSVNVPVKGIEEAGYTIIKELGRGGQGTMYLCTRRSWYFASHQYCVKFYEKSNANAGGLDELMDEYELMIGLNNQHIARTYDVFQDRTFYYLVNEPYFGGDLTKLGKHAYDKGVAMNETWWRLLFKQCLEGLHYLHGKGVMHCDIKEPNIMIAKDDDFKTPRPVLIDFGLSTAFTSTRDGVCGTPGYIPPETWQNGSWYVRGDILSLGIVFFQLISGLVPSKNGAIAGALVPVDGSDDFATCALRQALPWDEFPPAMPMLADLVELMTRRDREERPRAAQALKHAWFSSRGNADLPPENLHRLVGVATGHKIQEKLASQLQAANNLDELREARARFEEADIHGRGAVDAQTAMAVLCDHGVSRDVAKEYVNAAGGGPFQYTAITSDAIAGKEKHGKHYIKDLFDKLDLDKSGTLSIDELRGLLASDAFDHAEEHLDEILKFMDSDGDGVVSFDDFSNACLEYGRIASRIDGGNSINRSKIKKQGKNKTHHGKGRPETYSPEPPPSSRGSAHTQASALTSANARAGAQTHLKTLSISPNPSPFDAFLGRLWRLRISILSAQGLRSTTGAPSNVYCACKTTRDFRPSFETPVFLSTHAKWNSEHDIAYTVGDDLEFSVRSSRRAPGYGYVVTSGMVGQQDELLGVATLRWEHFFPHGFRAQQTLVRPGAGIGGLLEVAVTVLQEDKSAYAPRSVAAGGARSVAVGVADRSAGQFRANGLPSNAMLSHYTVDAY